MSYHTRNIATKQRAREFIQEMLKKHNIRWERIEAQEDDIYRYAIKVRGLDKLTSEFLEELHRKAGIFSVFWDEGILLYVFI